MLFVWLISHDKLITLRVVCYVEWAAIPFWWTQHGMRCTRCPWCQAETWISCLSGFWFPLFLMSYWSTWSACQLRGQKACLKWTSLNIQNTDVRRWFPKNVRQVVEATTAYCSLRNEMGRNEMGICSLRNGNLYFAKWKSVVCEMKICSLRNENL